MTTFSKYHRLSKSQAELDFVDVDITNDIPLYIDPYAFTTRDDDWSTSCHHLVVSYFQTVLTVIRENNKALGIRLLSHLGEPAETNLGVSKKGNKGRGVGNIQAGALFIALKNSKAAQSAC